MKRYGIITIIIIMLVINFAGLYGQRGPEKPRKGGCVSCLVAVFFGPRTGYLYNEGVGIRTLEIVALIGYLVNWAVGALFALPQLIEIWDGKTWTEVEIREELRDPEFKDWHRYKVEHESQ